MTAPTPETGELLRQLDFHIADCQDGQAKVMRNTLTSLRAALAAAPRPAEPVASADVIAEYLRFVMQKLPRDEADLAGRIQRLSVECAARLNASPAQPEVAGGAKPSERELELLGTVMQVGCIVHNAAAVAAKESSPLLANALKRAATILDEGLNGQPEVAPTDRAETDDLHAEAWGWLVGYSGEPDPAFSPFHCDDMTAAFKAGRAKSLTAPTDSGGWRRVPSEPTEAMTEAGRRQWLDQKEMDVAAIYRAMLDALPTDRGAGDNG